MSDFLYNLIDVRDWRYEAWIAELHQRQVMEAMETLPLRRDVVTVLRYVQDHKVVGTKSTGNMPRKHIREVCAQFVDPPELDQQIGDKVYKLRTEFEVWPLYFIHALAEVGDLLDTPEGRKWRLLPAGVEFLDADPANQLIELLVTWWWRVNWMIAYPVGGLGERLPAGFEFITLQRLRALPVGRTVEYEPFVDRLIERTGLTWSAEKLTYAQDFLRSSVRKMVIHVCRDFGVLEVQQYERGQHLLPEIRSLKLTPIGRGLLEAVQLIGEQLGRVPRP